MHVGVTKLIYENNENHFCMHRPIYIDIHII